MNKEGRAPRRLTLFGAFGTVADTAFNSSWPQEADSGALVPERGGRPAAAMHSGFAALGAEAPPPTVAPQAAVTPGVDTVLAADAPERP